LVWPPHAAKFVLLKALAWGVFVSYWQMPEWHVTQTFVPAYFGAGPETRKKALL
jgi:hypothetical protein